MRLFVMAVPEFHHDSPLLSGMPMWQASNSGDFRLSSRFSWSWKSS